MLLYGVSSLPVRQLYHSNRSLSQELMPLAVHSACKNFGGLIVVRLLLGVFEAASAPALILITGMWYKRSEQPLRIAIWYLGVGIGTIVGALASYGFQFYTGKHFYSWQVRDPQNTCWTSIGNKCYRSCILCSESSPSPWGSSSS